jgi:cobaltochelatase CobN
MFRCASLCSALALLAGLASVLRADPVRVVIASPNNPSLAPAVREFETRFGAGLIEVAACSPEIEGGQIGQARAILFAYANAGAFQRTAQAVRRAHQAGAAIFAIPGDSAETVWRVPNTNTHAKTVEAYWRGGSVENLVGLLATLYKAGGGKRNLKVAPPSEPVSLGIYHPEAGRVFDSLAAYLAWYRGRPGVRPDQAMVALSFYSNAYKFGDVAHIDALIRRLEAAGIGVAPMFAGTLPDMAPLLDDQGRCPFRLLLALNMTMSRPGHAEVLGARGLRTIHLITTRQSLAEWTQSRQGLPSDRIQLNYGSPERSGATEGTLIGVTENDPATGAGRTVPVSERIEALVARVKSWIRLQDKARFDRRVALVYYNNPPGKGNFGASYLNVPASLVEILRTLSDGGYRTGDRVPSERDLLATLELCGRNVGEWAPGEVEKLVTQGRATLLPVSRYREWFAALPAEFRKSVNAKWGPPESSPMMTLRSPDGRAYFVIPGTRLGNIFIGPQPFRSDPKNAAGSAHDSLTPPPHSYIAWYLWLRHSFDANAVVHVGRHGTLEWLPGKSVALAGSDPPEAVLGDLPNLYYYIMDGGGEAIQAKRRSAAVLISHRTPLMIASGAAAELRELHDLIDREEQTPAGSELSRNYREQILGMARRLQLDRQAGIFLDQAPWSEVRERLSALIHDTESTPVPLGLPVIGVAPDEAQQREALAEFLRSRFQPDQQQRFSALWQSWADAIFAGATPAAPETVPAVLRDKLQTAWQEGRQWIEDLRRSPRMERDALLDALDGKYLPSGLLGDPIRQPDALPSGRNLHSFDAALFPTKAAWEAGKKMAEEYLAGYVKQKGTYPEKVSQVLWFGETMRHHGSFESMAMWLLGVEPLWNGRGQIDELRLVPDKDLKRPRVDVVFVISSLYRDAVPHLALLLDRAAKLAATAGDSAITRNNRKAEQELLSQGLLAQQAAAMAANRVFSAAPGAYGTRVGRLVAEGNDTAESVSRAYLEAMSWTYGAGSWGQAAPGGLKAQLRGNQAVLFSRSSNLYGASDTHDVYETFGALGLASKVVNGAAPEMIIQNLRKPGEARQQTMQAFLVAEFHARQWNPRWISEMQKAGYAGARQFAKQTDALAGLTTTVPDSVDPSVWRKNFQVYVRDEYGLGLEKFFEHHNPAARQQQLARFLEVERRGLLPLSAEDRALLASAYVRSVVKAGAGCSALICGNRTLRGYAVSLARSTGAASAAEIRQFTGTLRAATSVPATGRPSAPAPSVGRGPAISSGKGGRMRIFTVSAEQWQQRLAAVGTLAFDPRIWAAIALMYCLALSGVATAKRTGQRRAALTELCLNSTKESHQDAHR